MQYIELKQNKQKAYDEAFAKYGVFFAFNKEQLEEGLLKTNSKGKKITSIGMGGYLKSENVDALFADLKVIEKEYKKAVRAEKERKQEAILFELKNYECFYTGDITNALEVLKTMGITRAEVLKVYQKHNKDDWIN